MTDDRDKLTGTIIGCGFTVINTLGTGFLEKVYENALAIELNITGLHCEQQKALPVTYRGTIIGTFYADIVVEGR